MTLHAALSLEQWLGSTVQYGRQSWAQCRAQRPVTPAPSCPGWQGAEATSVSSVTPLYCAVVRLTLREWLSASVGCDALSGRSVKAAAGLMPSQPRARRRIGTSSEAFRAGPRARRRICTSSEALRGRVSGEAESWYLVRALMVWASGESENRPRPRGCLLASIFTRSKQFFWFLLRVPLFMVSDSSP